MATNKIPNCPPLRFPDFSDEWQPTSLGEIGEIRMCKRILANQTNTERGIPFFKIGTIGKKEDSYISADLFQEYKDKYHYPSKGQILITCAGTIGRCLIFDGKDAYYQDSNIVWIDNKEDCVINPYLFYLLNNTDWSKLNRSTIVRLYNDDLRTLPISLPSLAEQERIASFLSLIDERIEACSETIKELVNEKKALLSRLFDQSLRFPQFSDPWQPTTLGEVCKVSTGSMNTQDKVEDGKYPFFVRSSRIERASHYTFDGIAILTPGDGAIGQIFHYSEGKIAVHQRVYMLTEMQCIPKYLFHFFSAKFFERASRMSAKNTVDSVRMSMITDMPISLPSLEEQRKIAEFLSLLDERISVEEELKSKYEEQKKYLLRQMFI